MNPVSAFTVYHGPFKTDRPPAGRGAPAYVALVFHRTVRLLNRAWVHYVAAGTCLLFAADIAAGYVFGVSVLPM